MDISPLLKGPKKPQHFPYESNFGGSKTLRNGHDDAAVVTRLHIVRLKGGGRGLDGFILLMLQKSCTTWDVYNIIKPCK